MGPDTRMSPGESQAVLLRKIEGLIQHIIEQEKRIQALEEQWAER